MVVYTFEQRWNILRHYFKNHGNVAECVRKLRTDFGRREALSAPYVRHLGTNMVAYTLEQRFAKWAWD